MLNQTADLTCTGATGETLWRLYVPCVNYAKKNLLKFVLFFTFPPFTLTPLNTARVKAETTQHTLT